MSLPYSRLPKNASSKASPFQVQVADTEIQNLNRLIKASPIGVETWENQQKDGRFGVTREWLTRTAQTWLRDYQWRHTEERINQIPQFHLEVQNPEFGAIKVHFAALFSDREDAMPIVLLHGWPGSFLEFYQLLSLLKDKYAPSKLPYHIVVPSLPGFAFSSGPPLDRDFGTEECAWVINQLMLDLGFGAGYVAQGGDFGCAIANVLGCRYDACKAQHVNLWMGDLDTGPVPIEREDVTEKEQATLRRLEKSQADKAGYAIEQGTRPATLGLVLSSSPLALLSWVGEKIIEWSDETPDTETILDLVTLYWFTSTASRSIYPYRSLVASFNGSKEVWSSITTSKPYGFSSFYNENTFLPKAWAAAYPNLVYYGPHEKGGHFVGLEQPETLLEDLEDFIRNYAGVTL